MDSAELMEACGHVDSLQAGLTVFIGEYCFETAYEDTYKVSRLVGEMWVNVRKECTETEAIILMAWAYKECI